MGCLASVAVLAILGFGFSWVAHAAHRARCQADAFITTDGAPTAGLFVTLALLGVGPFIALKILGLDRSTRTAWEAWAPQLKWKGMELFFGIVAAIAAVCAVVPGVPAILSQNCFAPAGITTQASPFEAPKRYAWDDIASVDLMCLLQGSKISSWHTYLSLKMREGRVFGLGEFHFDDQASAARYQRLMAALRGRRVIFDRSDVQSGCPSSKLPDTFGPA